MCLLQQKKEEGGIALPNITIYYQAALLDNLVQWWNTKATHSWQIEQIFVEQPLSMWALSVISSSLIVTRNNHIKTLTRMWKKLQGHLAPGQSPLASFLEHPKFQSAVESTNFQMWVEKGMSSFINWERIC